MAYKTVLAKITYLWKTAKNNQMYIKQIIKQPEGRYLEFKEILPEDNLATMNNKNHPKQKLRITKRGIVFLESLKK